MEPFNQAYYFEPLEIEHQHFIDNNSGLITRATLDFFAGKAQKAVPLPSSTQPIWLIVHTTRLEEVQLLLDHARDIAEIEQVKPSFIILSDVKPRSPSSYHMKTL